MSTELFFSHTLNPTTPWTQRMWLAAWCNFPTILFFPFASIPSPDGFQRRPLTSIPSQTPPSTQSVHLIGSWDNFSQSHPMQRDTRRGRDQWRGCYSFRDIVCDDVSVSASATCAGVGVAAGAGTSSSSGTASYSVKRHGGLKMGHTYYYYVCTAPLSIRFGICYCIVLHGLTKACLSPLRQTNEYLLPILSFIFTLLPNHLNTFNQPLHSHLLFVLHSLFCIIA